ncbi:MAG: type III PLP-dependent enzyme [Pseudomonadota bacterium]|nr:type III PLP-dependent enzyme [Pseudomonadota bacterium]QKK05409.1 MAG: type III PLP-dependent enzyme [Pseudomonadota bacterium]
MAKANDILRNPHILTTRPAARTPVTRRDAQIKALAPQKPLYVFDPVRLAQSYRRFATSFGGEIAYAVKCNPHPAVLQLLAEEGIAAFDVASLAEIRAARAAAPQAKLFFMHPVKAPEDIAAAYHDYGVRAFVLDHVDELYKILRATELAQDLELFVRLALPKNGKAALDFSSKFGAQPEEAAVLLEACRPVCRKLGLAFHVGTQNTDIGAYARAVGVAADVIRSANVTVDVLDLGGGFPACYLERTPSLNAIFREIRAAVLTHGLHHMELMAEPGRALVADCMSLIVRVEQRRGDLLYINDGVYGGLFDAGPSLRWRYPVRRISRDKDAETGVTTAFRFAGPTCDSIDMMDGPFMLPDEIKAGDWIEIKQAGAYSQCLRTDFNGFGDAGFLVLDMPGESPVKPVKQRKQTKQ